MNSRCECREQHVERKIVLTGGPGAGKTAVLELIRRSLCEHVAIVPEAAGVVFGGGFPRLRDAGVLRAAQRAIFAVQCELEAAMAAQGVRIMLCDRGAADGYAYWPDPTDYWAELGTTRDNVLRRYHAVIHLRVPDADHGYGHQNPLRTESASEALRIDERILEAWAGHPRRVVIGAASDFFAKARQVIEAVRLQLPECCRNHASKAMDATKGAQHVQSS